MFKGPINTKQGAGWDGPLTAELLQVAYQTAREWHRQHGLYPPAVPAYYVDILNGIALPQHISQQEAEQLLAAFIRGRAPDVVSVGMSFVSGITLGIQSAPVIGNRRLKRRERKRDRKR